jgi:spermidine/putrescine transport system permease protein
MTKTLRIYALLLTLFLYLPLAVMALFSFNDSKFIAFPLAGWTLRWYRDTLADGLIIEGLVNSLLIALPTAVAATVLGGLAAFAAVRAPRALQAVLILGIAAPFFIPRIILGVALLSFFHLLGISRGFVTVVTGQTLVILPFTTIIAASLLLRLDRKLDEAAADLGAGPWQTLWRVTLPLMRNGLIAAFMIAFILSAADVVMAAFLSGRNQPVSLVVASALHFELSPKLNALEMYILGANILLVAISEALRRRGTLRRYAARASVPKARAASGFHAASGNVR